MSKEHEQRIYDRCIVRVGKLEAENAKLRELVRHLYICLSFCDREDDKRGCGFCPYQTVDNDCEFEQRMRELGIEVDE